MSITTAHLVITGIGVASAGGLICGGYFVFKDNPKPVTELLKEKNKVFLKDTKEDEDAWNNSWRQYVQAHTKTITNSTPSGPQTTPAPRTPTPQRAPGTSTVVEEVDIWGLKDWKEQKSKTDKAPESFKNKCEEFRTRSISGTWTTEYQNIEKYCTKIASSENSE